MTLSDFSSESHGLPQALSSVCLFQHFKIFTLVICLIPVLSPYIRREDSDLHVGAVDWGLKVLWLTFCSIISSNDYSIRRVSFSGSPRPEIVAPPCRLDKLSLIGDIAEPFAAFTFDHLRISLSMRKSEE